MDRRWCVPLVIGCVLAIAGCGQGGAGTAQPSASPVASSGASASAAPSESISPSPSPAALPTLLPSDTALPSSGLLAYTIDAPGGQQFIPGGQQFIAAVVPDGSDPTPLAEGRDPSWWPDGQALAYACPGAANEGDFPAICRTPIGSQGGEARTLVEEGDRPSVSPDGTRLVFHRGMIDVGETWIAAADGSGARLLTPGALLSWSPDGTWLAGQPESATVEVAVIRGSGTGYQVLTGGSDPAWSPDGQRLAYALVTTNGSSLRYLDLASGTMTGAYLAGADVDLGAPAWLGPDRVLFVMSGDLWRIDAGAAAPIRLTAGLAIAGGLSLSPDARWVAFATTRVDGADVTSRLVVASVDGGWRVLDTGAGPASQPAWQPATSP